MEILDFIQSNPADDSNVDVQADSPTSETIVSIQQLNFDETFVRNDFHKYFYTEESFTIKGKI